MRSKARKTQGVVLALAFGLALLASACASPPPPPAHAVESGALPLQFEPRNDEIDCAVDNCVHWYRVELSKRGSLRLSVETFEPSEEEPSSGMGSFLGGGSGSSSEEAPFELALLDSTGERLGAIDGVGHERRSFNARVTPGVYLISVSTSDDASRFAYRVERDFKADPPKRRAPRPPPRPKYEKRAATILEFEGWGSDVEAVLIDLGSNHGMAQGMRGHFVQDGEKVGSIIVEQVYPEGSRATVQGALDRPLGSSASVEILVPIR